MKVFKFDKTFIINTILLLVAAMSSNQAFGCGGGSSVPWCDSNVFVKAIGGGKVYATGESDKQTVANCTKTEAKYTVLSNSHNSDIFPADTYLAAKPDDGWKFVKWECIDQRGTYSTSNATRKGTILTDALPKVQKSGISKRGGNNTGASGESTIACTDTNAIWYAYFEQVVTQLVKVESGNATLGTAIIDKSENSTGDEVTITAWCGNTNNSPRCESIMFLGWYKRNETTGEEEFVTRDNPFKFTITTSNQGTYIAHFASGYSFWRVKNNQYKNYLMAKTKYTGPVNSNPLTLQNALSTQMGFDNDLATAITDPGSMMRISMTGTQPRTGDEVWDIYVQDEHTNQYYGEEMIAAGVFLQLTHKSDNTYVLNGNNNSFYLYENSSGNFTGGTNLLKSGYWQLEGMDKDLTTRENYFTVDPSEFVGPDNNGYYWTTLRVCFNMKYEPSEITPYIVSAVDANAGTMELTEVTGGIIPAKACVLLRCNSKDITRNVMIPTTTNSTFNVNNNLLTSSTYYYKNQNVDNSLNFKGIMINDGCLGFGGNTLTQIDGNRAYLSVNQDVKLDDYKEVTLAQLVKNGVVGQKYRITDLDLTAVQFVDNEQLIICKDDNKYESPDIMEEGDIDFLHASQTSLQQQQGVIVPATYDQSNWIGLRLHSGVMSSTYDMKQLIAHALAEVKGVLVNKENPELLLDALPSATGDNVSVIKNVYVAANFNGSSHQVSENNTYFFVQPKPMELARIEWAYWDGSKFVNPPTVGSWNPARLSGEFDFNSAFLAIGSTDISSDPMTGYVYGMDAVIMDKVEPYDHIYVIGNVNGLNSGDWSPNKGVEMYTNDGKTYSTIVKVDDQGNNYGYFSFTNLLGTSWDAIASSRFGAVSNGDFDVEHGQWYDKELSLEASGDSYKIPTGYYQLTVSGYNSDMEGMKLVITKVNSTSSQAPRRRTDLKREYVAYPVTLTEEGSYIDGVITDVARVVGQREVTSTEYYNVAGIRSNRPWQGVNIVVTRYSDGTTSASKMLR